MPWRVLFAYVAAAFGARAVIELRNAVLPLAPRVRAASDRVVLALAPWVMLAALLVGYTLLPRIAGAEAKLPAVAVAVLAAITLVVQLGRRTAVRAARRAEERAARRASSAETVPGEEAAAAPHDD